MHIDVHKTNKTIAIYLTIICVNYLLMFPLCYQEEFEDTKGGNQNLYIEEG